MTSPANPWIAYRKPSPRAVMRLFCFHYAGGAASVFRGWQESFPPEIELCPVQLPGRESRLRETAARHLDQLLDALPEALAPLMDLPFAFLGHSMGSILSYELTVRLRQAGKPLPQQLLLSGRRAPHRPEKEPHLHDLPEDEFKKELRELNGTPDAVLEHPELFELLSPLLRADFSVCETYTPTLGQVLEMPISAFGGLADPKVSREDLEGWRQYTQGPFKLRMYPGDHFYLQGAARPDLIRCLVEDVVPTVERLRRQPA